MTATATPTTAAEARAEHRRLLLDVLDHWQDRGLRIPCRTGDIAGTSRWTSDHDGAQAQAAAACDPCPALEPCRAYGAAHPREAGVYGGITERDRTPRPRREAAA